MQSLIFYSGVDYPQSVYLLTSHGKPVHRRYFDEQAKRLYSPNYVSHQPEIARRLQASPSPYVAQVYEITDLYVDYELIKEIVSPGADHFKDVKGRTVNEEWHEAQAKTIIDIGKDKALEALHGAKRHLQSLGIYHCAWQFRDIGVNAEGDFKFYNFSYARCDDFSTQPYRAKTAIKEGMKTGEEVDSHVFNALLTDLGFA